MEDNKTYYATPNEVRAAIDKGSIIYADSENRIFEKHLDEYFIRNTQDHSLIPMVFGKPTYNEAYSKNVIKDLVKVIRKASLSLEVNGKSICIPECKELGFNKGDHLMSQWLYFIADMLEE